MSEAGTHFEILAMNKGSWQVQAVLNREDAAVGQAEDMHRLSKESVFKVVRVDFDNGSGAFRERQICVLGDNKKAQARYGEGLDAGPPCRKVEDFLKLDGRRAIRRVLRNWLEQVGIAPVELLHHPDYITRLENSGAMLQSAVQRAAMAQSKQNGQSLHDRQRELFRLADEVAAKARRFWRDGARLSFDGTNFAGLVAKADDADDANFAFNAALSDWLSSCKTIGAKLRAVAGLAEQAGTPRALTLLDSFLTDYLEEAAAISEILGSRSSLGEALLHMAELLMEEVSASETDGPDDFAIVKRLIASNELPNCRHSLMRRVISSLEGQRPLSEEGVAADAKATALLAQRLRGSDGQFIGGEEVEDALVRRAERFVNPDAIGRMLEGVTRPERRLQTLLEVESGVIGGNNKRRFSEYVVAILRTPANLEALGTPDGAPAVRMRELTTLQRLLLQSSLPDKHRQEGAQILDQLCAKILKRDAILEKIAARAGKPTEEGVAVLKLCAGGTFTEGEAADTARERAAALMRSPDFLAEYLRGAEAKNEKRDRLVQLEQLISAAKLPETPLYQAIAAAVK